MRLSSSKLQPTRFQQFISQEMAENSRKLQPDIVYWLPPPQTVTTIAQTRPKTAASNQFDRFVHSYIQNSDVPGPSYLPVGITRKPASNLRYKKFLLDRSPSSGEFVYVHNTDTKKVYASVDGHHVNSQREQLKKWTDGLIKRIETQKTCRQSEHVEYMFISNEQPYF